jgi:tetratricopeptide (TPR) repeat protein
MTDPVGTLEAALTHAARLADTAPELAAEQAREILRQVPNHPRAMLLLGASHRKIGNVSMSIQILESLVTEQPYSAAAHYELGLALQQGDRPDGAVAALRQAVALKPGFPDAWRALGDVLMDRGDLSGADAAYARQLQVSTHDPQLMAAASALCDNQIPHAETLLRDRLKQFPTDVAAIRMLAEVAGRLGRYNDAESLLARCLELAPSFHGARHNYAIVLHRQNKFAQAIDQIEQLSQVDPQNPSYRNLRAVLLARIGEYREAIAIYENILATYPLQFAIWMSYGHALAAAGRDQESIEAYRRCIQLTPTNGEAYWSLANLKTFRFRAGELRAMREQLKRTELKEEDLFHFHFALGKALEDSRQFAESFEHYSLGNTLRRKGIDYAADENTAQVQRSQEILTQDFFQARRGYGTNASDPIFIVGLPRAGSTLIEQILASHSAVEGTMELPDIISMARTLSGKKKRSDPSLYPAVFANLSLQHFRELGEQYLAQTRIQRKTNKPYFIDKMPNNFLHIGLIHLALPNAKIIDARRHPMACCFSAFKQHFARGQHYTYNLDEVGRYYLDYVDLMSHFDSALPGAIHRVFYESLVDNLEFEVRRLLTYCRLPFEPECLNFHRNPRPVRTASSQQVRKPIFREGLDHWRNFEPWLGTLKQSLGHALADYPTPT